MNAETEQLFRANTKLPILEVSTASLASANKFLPDTMILPSLATPIMVNNAKRLRENLHGILPGNNIELSYHPADTLNVEYAIDYLTLAGFDIGSIDASDIETTRMFFQKLNTHVSHIWSPPEELVKKGVQEQRAKNKQEGMFETVDAEIAAAVVAIRKNEIKTIPLDLGWRLVNMSSQDKLMDQMQYIVSTLSMRNLKIPTVLRANPAMFGEHSRQGEELLSFIRRNQDKNIELALEISAESQSPEEYNQWLQNFKHANTDLTIGMDFDFGHVQRSASLHPGSQKALHYIDRWLQNHPGIMMRITLNQHKSGETQTHGDLREGDVDFSEAMKIIGRYDGQRETESRVNPRVFTLETSPTDLPQTSTESWRSWMKDTVTIYQHSRESQHNRG